MNVKSLNLKLNSKILKNKNKECKLTINVNLMDTE